MKALLIGINSKYIHPSMGVFQLYTNSIYDCEYDEFTIKDDKDKILNTINESDADIIGISLYIWNIKIVKEILPFIKKNIFLGGPEASYNTSLLNEYKNVQYIIKGEGEESFNELMQYLDKKININQVSNLYYKNNFDVKYTYSRFPNLDNIKHDLSLIKDYKNRICYIESSRGCYYNCAYCLASLEKPVRYFPLEEVLSNIKFLLDNNARTIKFLDRSFGIKKEYINGILKFIKENDNGVSTFQFEVNADTLSNDTIDILNSMRKKSIRLEVGIQSTNPLTIKAINRTQNFSKLKENILKLKNNCVIHVDLIAGLPLENYESFIKSFNDTFNLGVEEIQLGFLKELKGTEISNKKDLYDYNFSSTSPYEVINNKYITIEEIKKIKQVEIGTDKFYNYGYFKKTIDYLFNELKLNPFFTLLNIVNNINVNFLKCQVDELYKALYNTLLNIINNNDFDNDYLLFILKQDYLIRSKIKPKIWWETNIDRNERNMMYEMISKKYNISIDELYHYGQLEKYDNKNYFLMNYKTNTLIKINKDC